MAIQAQSQYASVSESPALAMSWTMDEGRLRCRWVMARHAKPTWQECTPNPGESTEPTLVGRTQPWYAHLLGELSWLISLFC